MSFVMFIIGASVSWMLARRFYRNVRTKRSWCDHVWTEWAYMHESALQERQCIICGLPEVEDAEHASR